MHFNGINLIDPRFEKFISTVPEMRDHPDVWQDNHTSQFRTTSEHFPPVKTKDKMSSHPQ
jgi:hypothetical protein